MAGLQMNTSIGTLLTFLDAKSKITIWRDKDNIIFDGNVYHLYDMKEYHDAYITDIKFDRLSGIDIMINK